MRALSVWGPVCCLLSLGVSAARAPEAVSLVQQRAEGRSVIVLSDLHMGVGRDRSGAWHPYEDFRWSAEFAAFLAVVDEQSRGATDLVVNGDAFELWQSRERDCVYADADLGCTEREALARLERVLSAHDAEMKALGQLARSGSNRVVFVPGDHDAALLFPSVGLRVVKALAAPAGRVEVAASGSWRSADGQIYVEHGHQIGFSANRFENWPAPFIRRAGREHLVRPWGQQLIQDYYDRLEPVYPILDNVVEEGLGVKYGLAAEGTVDAGETAPSLLRYFLFKMAWQQFRQDLDGGDVQPPMWDLTKVRAQGPAFLIASVANDDRFKPLAAKALEDGRLSKSMEQLSNDELVALCDYRAAVRRARRRMERVLTQLAGQGPAVAECPRTPETMGSAYEYFWRSRDSIFLRRLEEVGRSSPGGRPIVAFVHGHTHLADRSQVGSNAVNGDYKIVPEGFSPVRNAFMPIAINDGAWQRTITPVQLDAREKERGAALPALLRVLQPEQLAPCYSFVEIRPYRETPAPAIRYWHAVDNGGWEMAASCGRAGGAS